MFFFSINSFMLRVHEQAIKKRMKNPLNDKKIVYLNKLNRRHLKFHFMMLRGYFIYLTQQKKNNNFIFSYTNPLRHNTFTSLLKMMPYCDILEYTRLLIMK